MNILMAENFFIAKFVILSYYKNSGFFCAFQGVEIFQAAYYIKDYGE